MSIVEHRYDAPDRFVAGTVGEPGERTFFLQAREGNRITSVVCEKQQVSVLAEHLGRILDEVVRRSGDVPDAYAQPRDVQPLDAPIDEEFRVGTMTLAWDPDQARVVIEMFAQTDAADDMPDDETSADEVAAAESERAGEVFVVRITPAGAREFVARANAVVAAGRPACPFCAQPLDPAGHICPRSNGYRRPLFASGE
ncbi:DUF3090 family protein [Naumannella cuiyingiana]|uniref:Putative repeat protein (TIGR03847 family) n=1 Tax=Naumannella cuiyingiana TaxID=1347891 RepID=A0A7Z0IM89_9ACTN|nr:DUF3090 family protein [Naumannella cuiyingiana]NYI72380.1 putative repeat protein (TIGR03847 family) [Naumannella cuiyingiana]